MISIIQERLKTYAFSNLDEVDNTLKEVIQEVALFALSRAGFFEVAAFQGGTSLRILHELPRFSEDIDFILLKPDEEFIWQPYLDDLINTFKEFGIAPEVLSKAQMNKAVRTALIKDSSIAQQLNLGFFGDRENRKLTIKLEIDTNPPLGSYFVYSYLDFPVDFEVCHQDKSSNFALKIHALLCRKFLKGRDWFDFVWYVNHGDLPNLPLLKNALQQSGPWQGEVLEMSPQWLAQVLSEKIRSIDWKDARLDVERFLQPIEKEALSVWTEKFFLSKLGKLSNMQR